MSKTPAKFGTGYEDGIVYGIMAATLIAQVRMFIVMLGALKWSAKRMYIPQRFPVPIILVLGVVDTFALHNPMFDVWVMLAFGALGYAVNLSNIPMSSASSSGPSPRPRCGRALC